MSVTVKDHGASALLERVGQISTASPELRVGIIEGDQQHGDDGLTMAELGAFHEFGTDTVPARSFIRAWYDEQLEQNKREFRKMMARVLLGQFTLEQGLERLGLKWSADVRQRIRGGIPPALKQATIDRKGSSTPLIDTGVLVSSITYEVK